MYININWLIEVLRAIVWNNPELGPSLIIKNFCIIIRELFVQRTDNYTKNFDFKESSVVSVITSGHFLSEVAASGPSICMEEVNAHWVSGWKVDIERMLTPGLWMTPCDQLMPLEGGCLWLYNPILCVLEDDVQMIKLKIIASSCF